MSADALGRLFEIAAYAKHHPASLPHARWFVDCVVRLRQANCSSVAAAFAITDEDVARNRLEHRNRLLREFAEELGDFKSLDAAALAVVAKLREFTSQRDDLKWRKYVGPRIYRALADIHAADESPPLSARRIWEILKSAKLEIAPPPDCGNESAL